MFVSFLEIFSVMAYSGFYVRKSVSIPYFPWHPSVLSVLKVIYYYQYPRDPAWFKALGNNNALQKPYSCSNASKVWGIFVVDIIITMFSTIAVWNSLAAGWGDLAVLAPLDWPYEGLPFLSGLGAFSKDLAGTLFLPNLIVSSSVHFFFCWRIWKLRRSYIVPGIIMIVGSAHFFSFVSFLIWLIQVSIVQWAMASFCGIHVCVALWIWAYLMKFYQGRQLGLTRIGELTPFVMVYRIFDYRDIPMPNFIVLDMAWRFKFMWFFNHSCYGLDCPSFRSCSYCV